MAQSGLKHLHSQSTLAKFTNIGRTAAVVMIAAVAVAIWQLSHVGYGISSGAYASVFFLTWIILAIQVAVLALWVLSLANRASYESKHAMFLGAVVLLAWIVTYFL